MRRHVTYGMSPQADYRATDVRFDGLETHFTVHRKTDALGEFMVRMPGAHNVQNALAVLAAADELEVPLNVVREAMAQFHGVQRRFTVLGQPRDVMIVDDYGHHPAEIRATLAAAKNGFARRVVVAFQPHRYTRTHALKEEFAAAFGDADVLFVTDVYPAGEKPIEGATGDALAEAIAAQGHASVKYVRGKENVKDALLAVVQPGDVVIALGAGDINASARALLAELEGKP
jgi:UDP-N-acetylmuramate--alanine ligase